jgi:hypothetical protein
MKKIFLAMFILLSIVLLAVIVPQCNTSASDEGIKDEGQADANDFDDAIKQNAKDLFEQGQQVFRFETFGDEVFWTDQLQLNKAIADAKHGGIGKGLAPKDALAAGLKVDVTVLPKEIIKQVQEGKILDDPAATLQLIKMNAVLGVVGKFDGNGNLQSIGLTCASCHSTVQDPSGIGKRLDGWPNRDLNVGAIV